MPSREAARGEYFFLFEGGALPRPGKGEKRVWSNKRIMIDGSGRIIDYLRISITDRCNLRCIYCMPESGICAAEHTQILSYEEIVRLVRIMNGLKIEHVRLTGGEPLARKGCLHLAKRLHELPGTKSLSMTTNGILLKDRVHEAKLAGITSVNISIDALDPDVYFRLTRGGDIGAVLCAMRQALDEGLAVKVNAVPIRGMNDEELAGIAGLARTYPLSVRFIELMPIGCGDKVPGIPEDEVEKRLEAAFGKPQKDAGVHGYGPARYVRYPGFTGSVGFISAISHEFCASCNRVRLTSDGQLKLCLNHTKGLDLRGMLRGGADDGEIEEAIREAIAEKPLRHEFYETIGDHEMRGMNAIGG